LTSVTDRQDDCHEFLHKIKINLYFLFVQLLLLLLLKTSTLCVGRLCVLNYFKCKDDVQKENLCTVNLNIYKIKEMKRNLLSLYCICTLMEPFLSLTHTTLNLRS